MHKQQGGWAGMIVLLLALAIVAYLAKDALTKYGLLDTNTNATTGAPGERTRSQAAGVVEKVDPTSVPTTPGNALERARGLEGTLKEQTNKAAGSY